MALGQLVSFGQMSIVLGVLTLENFYIGVIGDLDTINLDELRNARYSMRKVPSDTFIGMLRECKSFVVTCEQGFVDRQRITEGILQQ